MKRLRLCVSLLVVATMGLTRLAETNVQWQWFGPHTPPALEVIGEWSDAAGDLRRHGPPEGQLDLADHALSPSKCFVPAWPFPDLVAAAPAALEADVSAPAQWFRNSEFHPYRPPPHLRPAPRAPPPPLA